MVFQPAIIALLLASLVTTAMIAAAAAFGLQVIRRWDIGSGSELQITLERRTYLISTLLGFAFAVELASLLLFVFNADRMASQFVGAMCAVGTLNANAFGFPALVLKLANFFLAGVWLIMNHIDNRGWDYPLIRAKYRFLLLIAPMLLAEAIVQAAYFLGLKADVITSCCGSMFGSEAGSVTAEMASLPLIPSMAAFYAVMAAVILSGVHFVWQRKGGMVFAGLSGGGFLVSMAAMVSFISIYIYEHPHHHCPFDVIQGGYDYVGYALYLPLFTATVLGLGMGAILPYARVPSLSTVIPQVTRLYAQVSVTLFAVFLAVATWSVAGSNLIMLE